MEMEIFHFIFCFLCYIIYGLEKSHPHKDCMSQTLK